MMETQKLAVRVGQDLLDSELGAGVGFAATKLTDPWAAPAIRAGKYAGRFDDRLVRIDRSRVQFDVYGRSEGECWSLADQLVVTLGDLPGDHPEGVVSDVNELETFWQPDEAFDPPWDRVVVVCRIVGH